MVNQSHGHMSQSHDSHMSNFIGYPLSIDSPIKFNNVFALIGYLSMDQPISETIHLKAT